MNSSLIVMGIDPGLQGGVSFFSITEGGGLQLTRSERMPVCESGRYKTKKTKRIDTQTFSTWCSAANYAFIEHVAARPTYGKGGEKAQGEASTFNFGYGTGMLEGELFRRDLPFEWVYPTPWKKHFGLLKKDKHEAVILCNQFWPEHDFTRKVDSGRADATLIGAYGIAMYKDKLMELLHG